MTILYGNVPKSSEGGSGTEMKNFGDEALRVKEQGRIGKMDRVYNFSPGPSQLALPVLEKAKLPTSVSFDRAAEWEAMRHDKKFSAGMADIVTVTEIGAGQIERVPMESLKARFDVAYGGK